ncbi:MAG: hypothetical protein FWE74_10975 [Oscillospiraceae bacterium]|nr:hypothetical protein [Oscillospiraceae bacterium]
MKRFFLLVLIIIAVICTSCSGNVNPNSINFNQSYSFNAELGYNDRTTSAFFTRTAPDEWSGSLNAPFSLQGVEIAFTPQEMSISYEGFSSDLSDTPDINVTAFMLFSALEHAFKGSDVSIASGKDWVEITGLTNGDVYVLRLDKFGLPVTLEVPGRRFKVTFSDVTTADFPRGEPINELFEPIEFH